MIQRIHIDNPTSWWQEPPGAVGQVLLQLVAACREEGRQCRIAWEEGGTTLRSKARERILTHSI